MVKVSMSTSTVVSHHRGCRATCTSYMDVCVMNDEGLLSRDVELHVCDV